MRRKRRTFLLQAAAFAAALGAFARSGGAETPKPTAEPAESVPCSTELGRRFFPGVFVDSVLLKRGVEAGARAAMKAELAARDEKVADAVKANAETMHPNPIRSADRKGIASLYRKVLLEQFTSVLESHAITDRPQVEDIFDNVQYLRAVRLAQCAGVADQVEIGRGVIPIQRTLTAGEVVLLVPEAFPPSIRKQMVKEAQDGTVEKRVHAPEKKNEAPRL